MYVIQLTDGKVTRFFEGVEKLPFGPSPFYGSNPQQAKGYGTKREASTALRTVKQYRPTWEYSVVKLDEKESR